MIQGVVIRTIEIGVVGANLFVYRENILEGGGVRVSVKIRAHSALGVEPRDRRYEIGEYNHRKGAEEEGGGAHWVIGSSSI